MARELIAAKANDGDLGPLKLLPGKWSNTGNMTGRGWNIIALPFGDAANSGLDYRVLMNRYNEVLNFALVDKQVPNRGIGVDSGSTVAADQLVVMLDYEQTIKQIEADDFPKSGHAGGSNLPIHHEPGLWLHMTNERTNQLDIGRLATVPHGNSLLALGTSLVKNGPPNIPDKIDALPIGVEPKPNWKDNPYLEPYKHFDDKPFKNLFMPTDMTGLLKQANAEIDIVRTTILEVDTTTGTGGVVNIPFIVKQANAAAMKSTFWIQELADKGEDGNPRLRLQYLQVVLLEFFERRDGSEGLIQWPHVSINTMEKEHEATDARSSYERSRVDLIDGARPYR